MGVWSTATTPSRPDTEPWISELFPDPATPVTTTSTPRGTSTSVPSLPSRSRGARHDLVKLRSDHRVLRRYSSRSV
jgi:hypothetical protein